MHRKEKLAKEWLKAKDTPPTEEEIKKWAGSDLDLATITLCILHPEELYVMEKNNNKEDLTNFQTADAISEYISHPKWFKIFVPINPFSLNILVRNHFEQMDFIKPFLDSYRNFQADEYLNELHFNGVITFPIKYKTNLDLSTEAPKDFNEVLVAISKKIPLATFEFEDISTRVFNFFLSEVPKELGNPLAFKDLFKFIENLFKEYNDTLILAQLPTTNMVEFISSILRIDSIEAQGQFKNGEDHLSYEIKNPFDTTITKQTINIQLTRKAKLDAQKEILTFGWSTAKVAGKAIAMAVAPEGQMFSGILDPFETAEEVHEWISRGTALFKTDSHLMHLYKEYSEQTAYDSFEMYVKNKINIQLAKTAYTEFGIPAFDIPEKFLDKVYDQFYFFNVIKEMAKQKKESPRMIDVHQALKKQKLLSKTTEDASINQLVSEYVPDDLLTNIRKKIIL